LGVFSFYLFAILLDIKMKIDPKYLRFRKHYVFQSIYALISIFILTLILHDNPVLIASIGSMAFIIRWNNGIYHGRI